MEIMRNFCKFNVKMLKNFKFDSRLRYSSISFIAVNRERNSKRASLLEIHPNLNLMFPRHFEISCRLGRIDRREHILSTPKREEGVEGEKTVNIDVASALGNKMFPDEKTPDLLFNGVRFAEIPICHIKATKNNTIMQITDWKGKPILIWSCGAEGFKNARKGTNIAAQAAGITVGKKCADFKIKTIRVKVAGLGPGRMASVKGLEMSGINIISITDATPIPWCGPRPKKQRRL